MDRAEHVDLLVEAQAGELGGAEGQGGRVGVVRAAVVEADEAFVSLLLQGHVEVRRAQRLTRAEHALHVDPRQVADQQQAALQGIGIQRTFFGQRREQFLHSHPRPIDGSLDLHVFEVTLDHLQAYLAALDALLRHHYLGQQVPVLAVLGGEAVGQVDQFGQGHLLAEHMLVIGLEHRLVIAGVAFDAYLAQFEADLFAALRRDLLGHHQRRLGLGLRLAAGLEAFIELGWLYSPWQLHGGGGSSQHPAATERHPAKRPLRRFHHSPRADDALPPGDDSAHCEKG